MKKNIFTFIGIGLITGALIWGLVQASGVQVNQTPSITDSGPGSTILLTSTIQYGLQTPAAQTAGNQNNLRGQNGGACCEEGTGMAGGGARVLAGDGGPGDGANPSGLGGQALIQGGDSGSDGGGGRGNGGNVALLGGASGTSAAQGAVTISGRQLVFLTNGANQWQIELSGELTPSNDSAEDIGTSAIRPRVIYGDTVSTQNTPTTLGVAAATFAQSTGLHTMTGDAGGNTVTTITAGVGGQTLTLLFVDSDITITDDNAHTADTVDLNAAFVSADDTTLQLLHDGTSWYELTRSVN